MLKNISVVLFAVGLVAGPAWSGEHSEKNGGEARVAGGETVVIVRSERSDKEWAKARPDYTELKPGTTR